MKIDSAALQMSVSHSSLQQREVSESLKMWVGPQRPGADNRPNLPQPPAREAVVISDAGKAAATASTEEALDEASDNDPRLMLMRLMLEAMTGKPARIFNAREMEHKSANVDLPASASQSAPAHAPRPAAAAEPAQAARPAGFGIEYDFHATYSESEATHFASTGSVKTADGREINFKLELSMARQYTEETSISLRLGDAAKKVDPLVLNFAGNAASLTDQRFSFDLNADGEEESISRLASGSAYLVFDRNADGKINDGSEMFGPTSGDGFTELAALDDDQNGWIDENDQAFEQLSLWQQDGGKDSLSSLAESGVGAIALANISTPFELKTTQNESLGEIRNSGIFLQENGKAGTIQQIDLTV